MGESGTLVVRDRDGVYGVGPVCQWTAYTWIGSLSADPIARNELARAWLRYRPGESMHDWPWAPMDREPAGWWLWTDLACRQVICGGGFEMPKNRAIYDSEPADFVAWDVAAQANPQAQHDTGRNQDQGTRRESETQSVWIHLPPGWTMSEGRWPETPPCPVQHEPLDFRGVFYGRAFTDYVAEQVLAAIGRGDMPPEYHDLDQIRQPRPLSSKETAIATVWYDASVQLHRDWLMTAREDLEGQTPHAFLHRDRDWVDCELENRRRQWQCEGAAPHPLDSDSYAYRYGPMGTNEVVCYFDFCRDIIYCAWAAACKTPDISSRDLSSVLKCRGEEFLDADPLPPSAAVVIDHERRRMPLTDDGGHLDDDCPVCRLMRDSAAPSFLMFDGHHLELDCEYAFSLMDSYEEWSDCYGRYREQDDGSSPEMSSQASDAPAQTSDAPSQAVVLHASPGSFVVQPTDESDLSTNSLLMLAMQLADIIGALQAKGVDTQVLRSLNDAFDAYRGAHDGGARRRAFRRLRRRLEKATRNVPGLSAEATRFLDKLDEHRRDTVA